MNELADFYAVSFPRLSIPFELRPATVLLRHRLEFPERDLFPSLLKFHTELDALP